MTGRAFNMVHLSNINLKSHLIFQVTMRDDSIQVGN